MVQCVDDLLFAERATTAMSAFVSWRWFAEAHGWDVPDEKSPPPKDVLRTLGATTDISEFPDKPMKIRAVQDRVDKATADLEEILSSKRLMPAQAGKLYGRLQFASSCYYGRLGKALLRAFSRRQHEDRAGLNTQIQEACRFWIRNIQDMRPREVPVGIEKRKIAISYSDGEGDTAGVGVALWLSCGTVLAGYLRVPDEVREIWGRNRDNPDRHDIYEIEAVGPLLVLWNWGHRMKEHLWIHFIDNDAALSGIAKGSSSVLSGEVIIAYTHELAAKLGVWPWFDRVDTHSNPVDQLSRGKSSGNWTMVKIRFPRELVARLHRFLRET